MKYIKLYSGICILLFTIGMTAQQDPNRTFFRYNMNLINPAYTGIEEKTELGINFRSQWSGVVGAPESQSVFFGTNLGKNTGLGISVINDRTFIESQTWVAVDFSYHLKLSEKTNLYFGLKAGANTYSANTQGLLLFDNNSDLALANLEGGFKANIGAGVLLKGADYFISFSAPRILEPQRLREESGLNTISADRIHYYLASGYDLRLSNKLVFKASALTRYVYASPLSLDLQGAFSINKRVEFGVAYRLDEGYGGLFIFNAAHWLDLGYHYGKANANSIRTGISNGSHEVFVKLTL